MLINGIRARSMCRYIQTENSISAGDFQQSVRRDEIWIWIPFRCISSLSRRRWRRVAGSQGVGVRWAKPRPYQRPPWIPISHTGYPWSTWSIQRHRWIFLRCGHGCHHHVATWEKKKCLWHQMEGSPETSYSCTTEWSPHNWQVLLRRSTHRWNFQYALVALSLGTGAMKPFTTQDLKHPCSTPLVIWTQLSYLLRPWV